MDARMRELIFGHFVQDRHEVHSLLYLGDSADIQASSALAPLLLHQAGPVGRVCNA